MANLSGSNSTNTNKVLNTTMEAELSTMPFHAASLFVTVLINSVTCPFTALLNVLVIKAVKRRPRLQSKTNILLACLAVTDATTGLVVQPSFILWRTFQLLDVMDNYDMIADFHSSFFRGLAVCSSLHLMLVTCERLIAIKFTMNYPIIVIKRNIKAAVITFWIFFISFVTFALFFTDKAERRILNFIAAFILVSCVLFIASTYLILYRETRRHQKMIKTQQLPQEEVRRFAKESKALKTTVLVVGAVIICFLPIAFFQFLINLNVHVPESRNLCKRCPWVRTFLMLNSLLNPLIYCWRQKEMRQFVFRLSSPAVEPEQN